MKNHPIVEAIKKERQWTPARTVEALEESPPMKAQVRALQTQHTCGGGEGHGHGH